MDVIESDLEMTIDVDGVWRPVANSAGRLIHPTEEDIRNFWRWFGDSKVVDEQGRPLVVYHGTGSEFSIFSEAFADEAGVAGKGFYFTSSGDEASSYAERCDTPNVIAAYVSISNPLVILAGRLPDGRSVIDVHRQYASVTNKKGADEIRSIADQNNNDGVVWLGNDGSVRHVVAFRPEQIKSAIGNRGTFDPSDPRLTDGAGAQVAGARHAIVEPRPHRRRLAIRP